MNARSRSPGGHPHRRSTGRQGARQQGSGRRVSARGVVATVLGIVLSVLLVFPWPQRTPDPVVFGVMPAPLFFWLLWTALFIGYIAWIAYVWDPYADIVERQEKAGRTGRKRGRR